jgi:hypothetical protein
VLTPHEVMIFSVEEVLMDIYDGNHSKVDTEVATKALYEWLTHHDAHYYSSPLFKGEQNVLHAVLDAINRGKHIVVVASLPDLPDND